MTEYQKRIFLVDFAHHVALVIINIKKKQKKRKKRNSEMRKGSAVYMLQKVFHFKKYASMYKVCVKVGISNKIAYTKL